MNKLTLDMPSVPLCPEQDLIQQIQRWGNLAQQTSLQLKTLQHQVQQLAVVGVPNWHETVQPLEVMSDHVTESTMIQTAQDSLVLATDMKQRSQVILTLAQKATAQLKGLQGA